MTLVKYRVRGPGRAVLRSQTPPRFRMEIEIEGFEEVVDSLCVQPRKWGLIYEGPHSERIRAWLSGGRIELPRGIWQFKRVERDMDSWGRPLPHYDRGIYGRYVGPLHLFATDDGSCDVIILPSYESREVQIVSYRSGWSRRGRIARQDVAAEIWLPLLAETSAVSLRHTL